MDNVGKSVDELRRSTQQVGDTVSIEQEFIRNETRRLFFKRGANALGFAALAALTGRADPLSAAEPANNSKSLIHHAPKAKRVIYLHMVGAPRKLICFDHKPKMDAWYDVDLPESVRNGQRLTTMTSGQTRFPIAPSKYQFKQHGKSGMWLSELLPWKPSASTICALFEACIPKQSTTNLQFHSCKRAIR